MIALGTAAEAGLQKVHVVMIDLCLGNPAASD